MRPDTFFLPTGHDLSYQWVQCSLEKLDEPELTVMITDAWRMGVPKSVAAAHRSAEQPPQL